MRISSVGREREVLGFRSNKCLTSARRGDGLGYISIWATPPRRLVFWDGAPGPSIGDIIVLRRFALSVPHSNYCISELFFSIQGLY